MKDVFVGEAIAEQIHSKLGVLAANLRERPSPTAIREFVGSDFRATALGADGIVRRHGALEVSDGTVSRDPLLDASRFFQEFGRLLARFHRIEGAEFHITGISVKGSGDEAIVQTEIHYELLGFSDTDGRRRTQNVGDWRLVWARSGGDWKITEWRPQRRVRAGSDHPLFVDVTEIALGHNESYRDQIRWGVDPWRSSLDAAIGVDVYGHHGVSLGDIDGDGDSDLYVSQPAGLPNRLFRNDGGLAFTDITDVSGTGALDGTSMSILSDLDNDNDQDLLLISARSPMLLRNDGMGKFQLEASAFALTGSGRSQLTSAAVADYDRDGDLDLYVCSYRYHAGASVTGAPAPYHDANNGPPNHLFRNRGDGTFEDVTRLSGMDANNTRFSFAAAWGDYDRDGWPDLYVANDFGRNNLYRNNGDGSFSDVAREAGLEDLGAGMSAAWFDHDLDGNLDLYVGNMWSSAGRRITRESSFREDAGEQFRAEYQRHAKGNSLFRGDGDGRFQDVSTQSGSEMGRWAWSSDALDLNNDGFQEIYVANGYVTNSSTRDL